MNAVLLILVYWPSLFKVLFYNLPVSERCVRWGIREDICDLMYLLFHLWWLIRNRNFLLFENTWFNHGSLMWFVREHLVQSWFFDVVCVDHHFRFLRYVFLYVFFVYSLFVLCTMLPVLLDCPFLIAHSFESKLKTKKANIFYIQLFNLIQHLLV